jgi:magnesium transporter
MENITSPDLSEGIRSISRMDVDSEFVSDISELITSGEQRMVLNILSDLHSADVAEVVGHLSNDHAQLVLSWLPVDSAAEIIAELDDDYRALLLEETSEDRLTALLDELESDDAADVIADLPDEVKEKVLPTLEDAAEVQELLSYDEDTAGGLMAAEFVSVFEEWTVEEATEEVRRNAEEVEDLFAVFVTDETDRLRGQVSLKRLLLSPAHARISDIYESDLKFVTTDVDQEEVARKMERYDLVTLPVVDMDERLVGRITIDDVVDVIREEAEEDIQRMSGVSGGEEVTDSILRTTLGRLPWLLAGLVGASLAASVIWFFNGALKEASILAGFIPIIMATAGNAGIQSSAITVQRLASGDIYAGDMARRLGKEIRVAMLNATVASGLLGLIILVLGPLFLGPISQASHLALTAMIALITVIVQATALGTIIPLMLHKMGIDPALATGPFITTSNDIIGILVFFLLAELIYL